MKKANKLLKVATVCTGIGSPEQALKNLKIDHKITFACEIDKYARQTYLSNFEPKIMVNDMTKESFEGAQFASDLFIGGIPCQAFSMAGKRMGELDSRGLLFYDFYRYVQLHRPKYFIIENVKGLLSSDRGRTFQNWIQLLGRSVNQHITMYNHPDSLEYNLHWQVLNTKDYGLPQNRERVFLVGIRPDLPNDFRFPKPEPLKLRLKDILQPEVDEKYYLSEKLIAGFMNKGSDFNGRFDPKTGEDSANCITASCFKMAITDNYVFVREATKQGYSIANEGDSINLLNPKSETRRGRVGKQIANTLDTACAQAVIVGETTNDRIAGWHENENIIGAHQGDAKRSSVSEHIYHKEGGICTTIQTAHVPKVITHRIRRLTPLECFRLQGYPDSFVKPCSDSQLYKQAGNSISVAVIEKILYNLLK